MNPNRMGLEEQTEAHALLAKAANHPDWRVASHALDELMRRLVLHRLLEAEERVAPPGASKRSHGWQSQKLTSLTLLLAPDLELSLATDRVGARSGTCWAQPSSCRSAWPDARWPVVAATVACQRFTFASQPAARACPVPSAPDRVRRWSIPPRRWRKGIRP
jgi:hypothetical protein